MAEMRALTVRVPWSHMIAHCGKTVENRPRPTRFRGLLAIHAGAYSRWDQAGADDPRCRRAWREWSATLPPLNITGPLCREAMHIDFGAVIAVAEVTGCHHSDECMMPASQERGVRTGCSKWAARDQWHIELALVRPLPEPVPCRGMLSLWRLPEDVEKAVRAQLEVTDADCRL